jgi:hypothetical protein
MSKRRSLSKFTARARKNSEAGLLSDLTDTSTNLILPGIVAYTGTRVAGRVGYALGKRRSQRAARHLAPWTSVAVAMAAVIAAGKWDKLKNYEVGILVGASIGAIQSLLSAYIPSLAWIVGDYELHDQMLIASSEGQQQQTQQRRFVEQLPGQNLGAGAGHQEVFKKTSPGPQDVDVSLDDFGDIPGMDGSLKTGIFAS